MSPRRSRLFALLLISLGVMTAALVGQTLIYLMASTDLTAVDRVVETEVTPALVALEAAEGDLDRLEHGLDARLRGEPRDRALLDSDIDDAWKNLQESLATYLALPVFPGEPGAQIQIRSATKDLERAVQRITTDQVLPKVAVDDLARALTWSTASMRTAIRAAVDVNAEIERTVASRLHSVRLHYLPAALLLDVVCVAAGAVALVVTYYAVGKVERRADELDAFAGRVAHDLMSPLMTVTLALATVEPLVSASEHPRARAMLARAGASVRRAGETISDLLEFARAGAAPCPGGHADPRQVLPEVAADFGPIADETQVELTVEATALRAACCAPGVLRSILGNLVQNAIKYIEGGSARRVTLRAEDEGEDRIRFEVEDTGPGIAAADQARIFEPYVRAADKGPGIGLGLATVKQLAEAHGGRVGVVSDVGRGARFWVTLPSGA